MIQLVKNKINLEDWKSKDDSIKLESLIATATFNALPFDDSNKEFQLKSAKEKRVILKKYDNESVKQLVELIKKFPNKPHPLHPTIGLYNVTATIGELIKLAKSKIVGYAFIWDVKNAININSLRHKEWTRTKKVDLVKVELVVKGKKNIAKNRHIEIWMVKANSFKNMRTKVQNHFNQNYSNDFTGRIIDYHITDIDEIQNVLTKGDTTTIYSEQHRLIDKQDLKENKFMNLSLTL